MTLAGLSGGMSGGMSGLSLIALMGHVPSIARRKTAIRSRHGVPLLWTSLLEFLGRNPALRPF